MMDGVTILNEIEVVHHTFNTTAGSIALGITIIICAIAGFLIGRIHCDEFAGTMLGVLAGIGLGSLVMLVVGLIFSYPLETTTRYEVTIDDSVSLVEFYEHYTVVEQRGELFVVEETK